MEKLNEHECDQTVLNPTTREEYHKLHQLSDKPVQDDNTNSLEMKSRVRKPQKSETKTRQIQNCVLEMIRTSYIDVERRKKAFYQAFAQLE